MSDYNMSHTGEELDEAINKVRSGYIKPEGTKEITSNGEHPVAEYANVNVAVPTNSSESDKEMMVVSANFSFETKQVTNVSHTFREILDFVALEKVVKLKIAFSFPGSSTINYAIGDLTAVVVVNNVLVFSVQIVADLGAGESLLNFHIEYSHNNRTVTTIRAINAMEVT